MSSSTIRQAAFGVALCVAAPALWALPTLYHLQDLGANSEAVRINAKGQAAGTDTTGGQHHAAIWTDGVMSRLGHPHTEGDAYGLNTAGVVVGVASTGYGEASLWTRSGNLKNLDRGFAGSEATAINDKRDCVINGAVDAETLVAYLAPGCHPSNLVQIGAYLRGVAINANDQVALTDQAFDDRHRADLYTNDGLLQDLGVLTGYSQSFASDLNFGGHVVGTSSDGVYDLREGFFWNGRKLLKVGTLGGKRSEARGVNVYDVVVGSAQTRKGAWHPFVRDMRAVDSRAEDLQTMLDSSGAGWSLTEALSINKSGQILVHGTAPGDSNPRSAILTPVD